MLFADYRCFGRQTILHIRFSTQSSVSFNVDIVRFPRDRQIKGNGGGARRHTLARQSQYADCEVNSLHARSLCSILRRVLKDFDAHSFLYFHGGIAVVRQYIRNRIEFISQHDNTWFDDLVHGEIAASFLSIRSGCPLPLCLLVAFRLSSSCSNHPAKM